MTRLKVNIFTGIFISIILFHHIFILDYLTQRIEYINNVTEYWMDKYEKEYDSLDLDIQINTETIAETKIKITNLEELLAQRKINIDTYREYRTKKDIAMAKIKRKNNAAIAIQVTGRVIIYLVQVYIFNMPFHSQSWFRAARARKDIRKLLKKWKGKGKK